MKKFFMFFLVFFLIYSFIMVTYFLNAEQTLPEAYVGSSADPSIFMTPDELETANIYSKIKNIIFFIGIPWEWVIYLIILALGFSSSFAYLSKKVSEKSFFFQAGVFVILLTTLVTLLKLPLVYYSYKLSLEYGVGVQPFNLWLVDQGKNLFLEIIMMIPIVWVIYRLMLITEKKWWFWTWLLAIPFVVLMYFLQPLIIDPLFNEYQPLQDKDLKAQIMTLAEKADISIDDVYQVNMSEKTTAMNAYVTGIGSSARIVLWDTTINKLTNDEILFIMAHEIGHYVHNHIYWNLLLSIISLLIILYIVNKLMTWFIQRHGGVLNINSIKDIKSLPLILLLVSIISFAALPIQNGISRQAERVADDYAINMTHDEEAAVSVLQKLSKGSLSDPNPLELVKIFRGSHPSIVERIYTISNSE